MARIYIGNLPSGIREEELEAEFVRFGRLRNVWVARKPPGFAFIEMDDPRDADDAVRALDGVKGWRVEISRNRGPPPKPGGVRGPPVDRVDDFRRSPPRRRSPSPYRRASPPRRRSPSPLRRRSPSPPRRRSPSPLRRRSPSPVRRRSPSPPRRSPPRRDSPVVDRRPRSPSPIRERSASPPRKGSPARDYPPKRERSPSPIRERSASPRRDNPPARRERSRSRSRSPVRD